MNLAPSSRVHRQRISWLHGAIRRRGMLPFAVAATLLFGAFGATTAGANAKRGLATGFVSWSGGAEAGWVTELNEAHAAGADFIRIAAHWSNLTPREPADPRNPADPAYDFAPLDTLIRDAQAHGGGLRVFLQITGVPSWAEGADRPPGVPAGTWKPRPGPARDFGHAIARRYSGSFPDPANPGRMLPRARYFQIFNEPNLEGHSPTPQWEGKTPMGALLYRRVLNAFYRGIKSVDQSNVVVTGGTGPYGDEPGGPRTRPLVFWRAVMCLRRNLRPASCPKPRNRAHFDVLAHHPVNTSGGPFQGAVHPDDASSPDMWKLRRTLRAAERHGTIRPGGRRPLWVTEFWYHPDVVPESLRRQAQWMSESLYLFWRGGASVALNLKVRDTDFVVKSGVYHADGTKKPAFTAFRFPFVAFKRGRRVELWGKAPRQGRVLIRRGRPGQWRRVTRLRSGANRVFHARVRMRGKPRLQAVAPGGERSLIYQAR